MHFIIQIQVKMKPFGPVFWTKFRKLMYFKGFNLQVVSPMYMRMGVASSMLMGLSYQTYVCVYLYNALSHFCLLFSCSSVYPYFSFHP